MPWITMVGYALTIVGGGLMLAKILAFMLTGNSAFLH